MAPLPGSRRRLTHGARSAGSDAHGLDAQAGGRGQGPGEAQPATGGEGVLMIARRKNVNASNGIPAGRALTRKPGLTGRAAAAREFHRHSRAALLSLIELGHRGQEHEWEACSACRVAVDHLARTLGIAPQQLRVALAELALAVEVPAA